MKDSEIFAWLKHNNDYRHIVSGKYDLSFNVVVKSELKQIWVVFEETQQKSDWLVNFNFPTRKYGGFWFHRGYFQHYSLCRQEVRNLVEKALEENPTFDVCCIGWSLGGALATISAEDLGFFLARKIRLLTFAAPKVCGTAKTAEKVRFYLSEDSVDYCNRNDFVPYMPLGFWHAKPKWIGKFNLLTFFKNNHDVYDQLINSLSA